MLRDQEKEWYSEVQISVTSESISSIMDVKLNVLKYPPLGQLAELLMLSLTGLRNTGVIIPSHQLARWLPSVLLHDTMSGGEETSHTHTHTNSSTHLHNRKHTQVEPSVKVPRLLAV